MNAKISHIEYYLPEHEITNKDLAKSNPSWDFNLIQPKTGIFSRHIAKDTERASDLAVCAAERLIQKNKIDKNTIDALILCTQSPDYILPTTACVIQERLKLQSSTAAFDFNLGCSGFIYGLAISSSMVKSGLSKKVLFLCAETYSKYIADDDRTSRTVFGDGAAATMIEPSDSGKSIESFVLGTDGKGKDKLIVHQEQPAKLYIDGPAIFMFSMKRVPECVNALLAKSGRTKEDIAFFIFHQASKVVIDNIIRILSLDEGKVFRGYEKIGNTISASIPIALKQAAEQKLIKEGDLIMLVGFGVGLSWGACLIRW